MALHLRRKYGEDIYYYKSNKTGIDIDFYLPEDRTAIQVAYALGDAEEREVRNLSSFARKTKEIHRLILVTYEEEKTIETDGCTIEVIPVHKFLLS